MLTLSFTFQMHVYILLNISIISLNKLREQTGSFKFKKLCFIFKGNAQFIQKMTFELLMDFKQNHHGCWKYSKSCYF